VKCDKIIIVFYVSRITFHVSVMNYLRTIIICTFCVIMSLFQVYADIKFTDVTQASGIHFQHVNGASGKKFLVETMCGGAAFLDYDNDFDLDVYLVNGADLPGHTSPTPPMNRLYRNNSDGTFTDVTEEAGVGDTGYGMGCCAGDYDNDGDVDIYVTNFGPNVLYRNNSDGTFTDVTKEAGVGYPGCSVGCAFADYDNDGDLDLFVANYMKLDLQNSPICMQGGIPAYCRPEDYEKVPNVLYQNNGDGTFTDVTQQAGMTAPGRFLGAVWGDYDDDGYIDLFVANDALENFLYHNNGDGTFTEMGLFLGVALNEHGDAENCMGVDFGDYDNDGALDIIVCNYQGQTNTIYHNDGSGVFWDMTSECGLGEVTLIPMSWGTGFSDFDNDGYLDLFFANGHLHDNIEMFEEVGNYKQTNQLLRNNGNGKFSDISTQCGSGLTIKKASRGAVFGDYDNDGDIDILVANIGESPDLLRSDGENKNHWLALKLIGTKSNRDAIGAKVILTAGNLRQMRYVKSGSSYLSQNDMRLFFGLGDVEIVESIEIRWPSGLVQRLEKIPADQYLIITEGQEEYKRYSRETK